MTERQQKITESLIHHVGDYIAREANRDALITPTSASISPDLKKATIYISVYPENREQQALAFLKRHERDVRGFLKSRVNFKVLPFVTFMLDTGEKNRQRIDDLLKNE